MNRKNKKVKFKNIYEVGISKDILAGRYFELKNKIDKGRVGLILAVCTPNILNFFNLNELTKDEFKVAILIFILVFFYNMISVIELDNEILEIEKNLNIEIENKKRREFKIIRNQLIVLLVLVALNLWIF